MKYFNVLLFILFFQNIFSQEDSTKTFMQLYEIVLNNNNTYIAYILSDDGREILIETKEIGKIYIKKSDVKSIEKINTNATLSNVELEIINYDVRYLFTPTAFPIRKKENYYSLHLYGLAINVGLSNRVGISFHSSWIMSPFGFSLKYSQPTKSERLNFSTGINFGTTGYIDQFNGYGGSFYANATLGTRTKNITFTAGAFGSNYDFIYPFIGIAGITNISPRLSFVYDCLFLSESNSQILVVTPSLRYASNRSNFLQFSIIGINSFYKGYDSGFPIPMLTLHRKL